MLRIDPRQLAEWLADPGRPRPQLLDVREPWEFDYGHLAEATLMPMASVPPRVAELKRDEPLVCICHHGGRSMQVALFLESQGFSTVYNLEGGMDAWSLMVDPAVRRY